MSQIFHNCLFYYNNRQFPSALFMQLIHHHHHCVSCLNLDVMMDVAIPMSTLHAC